MASDWVKSICLVFENCESVTFTKGLGVFHIGKLETSIDRVAINAIQKVTVAHEIYIQLFKQCEFKACIYDNETTPFTRINRWQDITSVEITYADNTTEQYLVNYVEPENQAGMLGAPNVNQKTCISKAGHLYIVIDANKSLEDVFNIDELDLEDDLLLENDIQSKYALKDAGWTVTTFDKSVRLSAENRPTIDISKNGLVIGSGSTQLTIDTEVTNAICSLVFDAEYCRNSINFEDEKFVCLEFEDSATSIKFKSYSNPVINGEYTYSDEHEFSEFNGTLILNDLKFDSELFYHILWLFLDFADDTLN